MNYVKNFINSFNKYTLINSIMYKMFKIYLKYSGIWYVVSQLGGDSSVNCTRHSFQVLSNSSSRDLNYSIAEDKYRYIE